MVGYILIGIVIGCCIGGVIAYLMMKGQRDVLQERVVYTEKQCEEQKAFHASQLEALKQQQKEQLELQMNLVKEQMNSASEKILKERSDSIEQSKEIGDRADKLAQALTGENKTQGNFGELRLKQLLEDMGLEEGVQFEEQTTMRDASGHALYDEEEGHRMVPDVILHFPDKRDVIIDSKMSLKAFGDYHEAETDDERQNALMRHIVSMRNHVNELARKNYSAYIRDGRGKLDFVMMYVYSENALQLALYNEPGLWKEAYDKGVIIVGSQNLYVMLRVLEMSWRQVRQIENQEDIMKAANEVVNRVQLFYERFQKVGEMLNKTTQAFDEMKGVSGPMGQSIEVAAKKLIKYGAKENPKRKYRLKDMSED